jgi:WD40 repeat protein
MRNDWYLQGEMITCCVGTAEDALGSDAAIALSPDETMIATGGREGTPRIWDSITGDLKLSLFGRARGQITALAYNHDGRLLASASDDGTATLWDASSGREMMTLSGHSGGVLGVAFSPNSELLYTASRDGTVKLWDLSPAAGSDWLNVRHDSSVHSVAFRPDGRRFATWSADGTARVWDSQSGEELLAIAHEPSSSGGNISYSPDGKELAVLSGNSAQIYDATAGALIRSAAPLSTTAGYVTYSPDGSRLALSTMGGIVKISDSDTGRNSVIFSAVFAGVIRQLAFSPDGARLAIASNIQTGIWDASTGEKLLTLSLDDHGVTAGAFSPDGNLLATTGDDQSESGMPKPASCCTHWRASPPRRLEWLSAPTAAPLRPRARIKL